MIGTVARHCFVITPDLAGFGESEPVTGHHFRVSLTMRALPRMVTHILDGPHFLLETYPAECGALMSAFLERVEGRR